MTCIFPDSLDVVTRAHKERERERERDYTLELLLSAVEGAIEVSSNVHETELFELLPPLAKYIVSGQQGATCKMKKKFNIRM